ncbi:aminoacyl-tRNA hydrolase [Alkalilimnicola ehrlichii MLHE-1]|uniref:Peptidyl-tRNA hydrolase n=1 Tax=Alkalilimnicola ehrlichii (strain ATCC BAA-1101 / DSM 17681 / MLHE-1) TaxID=187272 RepID=PTH_ALKEH|nr:aminoacyl-tRNA hydrolase [Alkalilimnicola ehrlichii]Q0ABZ7.1 RecName: Full=Peptidyl-tRNA hydrolase; Short=PTH [Alkalilimnicola ehrlichii MLHE-1]ABI55640.1 peptidyl-tRNA hydrolase [Alkalilimnicola ehrlichii MLHE-1]
MTDSPQPIQLIVGLGNPGDRYAGTRHNAGFWLLDELLRRHGGALRPERRYHADLATLHLGPHQCRLMRPQTYMNRSGQAVGPYAQFFRLPPESILVVHDEIDLPPGQVKLKQGGGHGGHNGLRDIIRALGNERGFCRARIGVGHPGHRDGVVPYVLSRPAPDERRAIADAVEELADCVEWLLAGDWGRACQRLHSRS